MFERFTDRARRVVVLAQEEARLLNHNYIGTEHILLGLIHEGEGVAAKALEALGVELGAARIQVREIIGKGGSPPSGHIPFSPRAKKVLELSLREALSLLSEDIGPEHVLLGLIREASDQIAGGEPSSSVGAQVLLKLGVELPELRQQIIDLINKANKARGAMGGSTTDVGQSYPPTTASLLEVANSLDDFLRKRFEQAIALFRQLEETHEAYVTDLRTRITDQEMVSADLRRQLAASENQHLSDLAELDALYVELRRLRQKLATIEQLAAVSSEADDDVMGDSSSPEGIARDTGVVPEREFGPDAPPPPGGTPDYSASAPDPPRATETGEPTSGNA